MALTSPAPRPSPPAGAQSPPSGKVNPIQVDQKLISAGDVLLDWQSSPIRHIRVDQVEIGGKGERTLTGVDLLTNAPVTLTWTWCLTYEMVIAGPKFDQVQARPADYPGIHQQRRIWKPQEAVA